MIVDCREQLPEVEGGGGSVEYEAVDGILDECGVLELGAGVLEVE